MSIAFAFKSAHYFKTKQESTYTSLDIHYLVIAMPCYLLARM